MFFYLKISCKDKRIMQKFLRFFIKIKLVPIFFKSFPKHEKRKFITVLKSPHVNKTAQEQFEYRFYSEHFLIRSFKPLIFLLLLKKFKDSSFSGLNIEVKGLFEKNQTQKHILSTVNPDNILLKNVSNLYINKKRIKIGRWSKNSKLTLRYNTFNFLLPKKYIQLFDLYGEICLKNVFYC